MKNKNRISLAVSTCMLLVLVGASIIPVTPESINIDIKPDSDVNPLNTKSKGVFTIVINGTDSLNVSNIDTTTILLNGTVAPIRCIEGEDVYGDGYTDLILKFNTTEVVTKLGLSSGKLTYTLTLTWDFLEPTEDPDEGWDTIETRPCWGDCKPTKGAGHSNGRG